MKHWISRAPFLILGIAVALVSGAGAQDPAVAVGKVVTDRPGEYPDETVYFNLTENFALKSIYTSRNSARATSIDEMRKGDGAVIKRKWRVAIVVASVDAGFSAIDGGRLTLKFRGDSWGTVWHKAAVDVRPLGGGRWQLYNASGAPVSKLSVFFDGKSIPQRVTLSN